MKNFKHLFTLLFSLFLIHVNAQSVQWADESPNTSKWFVNDVAGYTSQSVFLVKKIPEGPLISLSFLWTDTTCLT